MSRLAAAAALLSLSLLSFGAAAAPPAIGGDINAMPAGPGQQTGADTQKDAQAAFAEARAECRGEGRKLKRECVKQATREEDLTRRDLAPARAPIGPVATPQNRGMALPEPPAR
jgi:endonuclease/exonuclease/phosphatase family metal-dependent hydrolase